jgi:predicted O-methyltransferase YrrM
MAKKVLPYLAKRFGLDINRKPPLEIHNINRTIMAQVLGELKSKVGAEIGVAQGNHARVMCEGIPGAKLYCVDIWKPNPGYNEYTNRIRRYFQIARKQLAPYNCVFIKKFSMDAVSDFADESLDFVYIDGAHDFKNVADDICEWTKKVKIGGIVFGHDYKRSRDTHSKYPVDVKDVVQAYTYSHSIAPWFVLTNDIRDPNFGRDNPGWLFVRQKTDRT